jgi:hypothetical protein
MTWMYSSTGERRASIGVHFRTSGPDPWLRLVYTLTRDGQREDVDERFALVRFPQPFGGCRWYVICPVTGLRCQCLYLPAGATRFRSRNAFRCHLQYASQGMSPAFRLLEQAHKVADRVLALQPADHREVLRCTFPSKPRWMRWRTYDRLVAHWAAALTEASDEMAVRRWGM